MRIKRISLKNYRKFDKLEITFDQQMTVIAALNSSGKTTVLDAVRACLWAFVRRIDAASGSKLVGIHIDDVTLLGRDSQVEAQLPSVIAAETFDDLSWEISREKVMPKTNTRSWMIVSFPEHMDIWTAWVRLQVINILHNGFKVE